LLNTNLKSKNRQIGVCFVENFSNFRMYVLFYQQKCLYQSLEFQEFVFFWSLYLVACISGVYVSGGCISEVYISGIIVSGVYISGVCISEVCFHDLISQEFVFQEFILQ